MCIKKQVICNRSPQIKCKQKTDNIKLLFKIKNDFLFLLFQNHLFFVFSFLFLKISFQFRTAVCLILLIFFLIFFLLYNNSSSTNLIEKIQTKNMGISRLAFGTQFVFCARIKKKKERSLLLSFLLLITQCFIFFCSVLCCCFFLVFNL